MNKKKVLVAFDSQTMLAYVAQLLQEGGFDVVSAKNGIEVLDLLFMERPGCVLVYVDLPEISGWDLSRIIKNNARLRNTSVIICSNESTGVYHFWKDKSGSDDILLLHEIDSQKLSDVINKSLAKNASGVNSSDEKFSSPSKSEVIRMVADAGSLELFNLYIVQSAYETGTSSVGLEQIVDAMLQDLQGIYNYDAACIIINDEYLIERYDYSKNISKQDFNEFMQICHRDFESVIKNRKEYNWHLSTIKETRFDAEGHSDGKLKSYEVFPRSGINWLTIHIGSCDADPFNKRVEERITFFAKTYMKIVGKNQYYKRMSRAEQKMRRAFSRFVPGAVIDEIISGNEQTQIAVGEKRQVAIMMSDIRSFTSISEINEPENVVNFLNYFFSIMGKIIKNCGGTIDKFMGDAIMALFGAPESYEDNGNRAAQAALKMMEALKTIDTNMLVLPKNYTFAFGIGIHYGAPIVGSIGSQDKRDYTVIGDDVNLASRTEGLTKMYGVPIVVTGSVKDDLREEYNGTRLLDKVKVKGKSEPVEVYELIAEKDRYSKEFLDAYGKGIKQYMLGNFDSAAEYFGKAIDLDDADKAAQVLFSRCKEYIENPPEKWEGAVALTNK